MEGDAQASGQAVEKTVHAMREIAAKIAIIDDIARQTRMLSLNVTVGLMQDASAASKEQDVGADQVSQAIQQLAVSADTLARQAEHLQHAMAFFQLTD